MIRDKNKQISDRENIKKIANRQILMGLNLLLKPLEYEKIEGKRDKFFNRVRDTSYLSVKFRRAIIDILGSFKHSYKVDSINVERGRFILDDAIIKYNSYLDAETIIYINAIIFDDFFVSHYSFKDMELFTSAALEKYKDTTLSFDKRISSMFMSYGFYYRTSKLKKNGKSMGDYGGIVSLISKFEVLEKQISLTM
ncbi:hypothetical protein [Fibrella forsythiae]|uniref:Uncharacterized protein n=1 Tax=Fibrella forsythiae TaxID=2817061 RepID=A0ABS3JN25_9BACT|nr:hypothetical protein [Fibrella forsythiae]MBO0950878.1 hypothetical protein [Fibrella forsythiae]